MQRLKTKIKNFITGRSGFSLVELIVVIAIMAVMAAVLAPALLGYVEKSRMQKDASIMSEVVNSMKLSIADQEIYDELLQASVKNNYSCYADGDTTTNIDANKTMLKEPEYWLYNDNARLLDETAYFPSGKMRGVTITFRPDGKYNYVLKDGIINQMGVALTKKGPNAGKTLEDSMFTTTYNRLRSIVGDSFKVSSQTYRNSDYTIFISMGTTGGNQATNQDAIQVWGQYNGTNLSEVSAPVSGGQQGIVNPDESAGGDVDLTNATGGLYEYIGGPTKTIKVNGEDVEATWANLIAGDYIRVNQGVLSNGNNMSQLSGILVIDKSVKSIPADNYNNTTNFLYGSQITEIAFEEGTKKLSKFAIDRVENLKAVHLPASLETFEEGNFFGCYMLEEITVPGNSKHFKTVNGILYSKDGTILYKMPHGTKIKELTIPEGVKIIEPYSCRNDNLTKVILPTSCEMVNYQAFEWSRKLQEFVINGNPNIVCTALRGFYNCTFVVNNSTKYTVVNDCLIADGKILLAAGKRCDTIVIPSGITKIDTSALVETNVKTLVVPSSLQLVESYSFFDKLTEIKYQGTAQQFEQIVVRDYGNEDTTSEKWNAATKTYNYAY